MPRSSQLDCASRSSLSTKPTHTNSRSLGGLLRIAILFEFRELLSTLILRSGDVTRPWFRCPEYGRALVCSLSVMWPLGASEYTGLTIKIRKDLAESRHSPVVVCHESLGRLTSASYADRTLRRVVTRVDGVMSRMGTPIIESRRSRVKITLLL